MKYHFFVLLVLGVICSCSSFESEPELLTGERLAKSACGSCHKFPEPSLLPKEHWRNVLPRMGLRLGIESAEHNPFNTFTLLETQRVLAAKVFPEEQLLDDSLWIRLQDYYLLNAPDSLELSDRETPAKSSLFKTVIPDISLGGAPFISMVRFDNDGNLYLADLRGNLVLLDTVLNIDSFTTFPKPVIDLALGEQDEMYVLCIGELYPNDRLTGAMATFDRESFSTPELIFDNLPRPVQFVPGDLDMDGREDLLVCNFGNYVGSLSWFRFNGEEFEHKVIKSAPGATRAFLEDIDEDGDKDIIALFAQGDEGVSIFYNEVVKFREERVLRFDPLYGSNDMVLADMDADGDLDIVLSNGDNGDYSITLKPYHGVRIFLNDGDYGFEESFFYPFYGSSKVRVSDFNGDGHPDMVAASYFPEGDPDGLERSIVVLMNRGDMTFDAYSVEGADQGRWMVMDTGDYDRDGDVDVIVGSFTLGHEGMSEEVMRVWRKSEQYILVLDNQTIR